MTSVFLWYFALQIHQQILSALLLQCIHIESLLIAATATILIQITITSHLDYDITLPNLPAFTLFSLQCIPLTATWWSLITREWLCHSSIQNHFAAAHLHQSMGQHVYTIPARPLGLNLLFLKLLSFPSYHSTHPVYLLVLKQSKQYPSSGFLPFLLLSWKNFPQISVWLFFLFQVIA